MTGWSKLAAKIDRPDTKGVNYRDTHCTAFAQNKLFFFGRRAVEGLPGDSMSWHESSMLDGFVSIFDVQSRKWDFKYYPKVDDTHSHRDHVFALYDKVFMLVYGVNDCYWKLFAWDNDKWNEVKLDDQVLQKEFSSGCKSLSAFEGEDGLYIMMTTFSNVYKLSVVVQNGSVQSATCVDLSNPVAANSGDKEEFQLVDCSRSDSKVGGIAVSEGKMVAWEIERMCDWHWAPQHPYVADTKPEAPLKLEKISIPDNCPSYSYNGPRSIVAFGNKAVMLGGSSQRGLGHCVDNPDIWIYDMAAKAYQKSSTVMPADVPGHMITVGMDQKTGNVYLCDLNTGIYTLNAKDL